jgi:hypothetical protein
VVGPDWGIGDSISKERSQWGSPSGGDCAANFRQNELNTGLGAGESTCDFDKTKPIYLNSRTEDLPWAGGRY